MSWNPYKEWHREHIDNLEDIVSLFEKDQPTISGGDTETTGLHIKKDKAFLIVFGWLVGKTGRVFTFYPTLKNMKIFFDLAEKTKMFVWWNTTFDLHMMKNGTGLDYKGNNLVEGTVVARLCTEAVPANAGGDDLKLKSIGGKYVHWQAANSEKMIKDELRRLKDERIKFLTAALKQFDHPTEQEYKAVRLDTGKTTTKNYANKHPDNVEWKWLRKKWNKGLVEAFLKDITHEVTDLPEEIQEIWTGWKEEYPDPTYEDVDRDLMIKYAGEDVITMLEYIRKAIPVLTDREQWRTVKRESRLIKVIYRMERVGFRLNRTYLEESRIRLKNYIIRQREEMYSLAGERINVGQKPSIMRVYKENWNIDIPSSDKNILKKLIANEYENYNVPEEARRYATLIKELRTLEKWYSTYCVGLLEKSAWDGRFYTQVFQAGAVSGRVGSDAQQFPKDPIKDENGNELFHPRQAFVPTGDGYDSIYYLDYSQIELRNQANYTLLVSGGDLNLCRAYMPFKCYRIEEYLKPINKHVSVPMKRKIPYDYSTPEKRAEWNQYTWYQLEDDKEWHPTDVHGQTTHKALMLLDYSCHGYKTNYTKQGEDHFYQLVTKDTTHYDVTVVNEELFNKMRSKGKIFNFMRNYGGGKGAAMKQLDLPENVADAMVNGYSESFPEVLAYQNAIIDAHYRKGYVTNMYGRRYYLVDNQQAYKLANYNVQGTCADMMKDKMIECDNYLQKMQAKGYKTRMVLPVHDEIQFESCKGEEFIIAKLREIMQELEWHLVPIVCDVEVTYTNWQEKEEVKELEV